MQDPNPALRLKDEIIAAPGPRPTGVYLDVHLGLHDSHNSIHENGDLSVLEDNELMGGGGGGGLKSDVKIGSGSNGITTIQSGSSAIDWQV